MFGRESDDDSEDENGSKKYRQDGMMPFYPGMDQDVNGDKDVGTTVHLFDSISLFV